MSLDESTASSCFFGDSASIMPLSSGCPASDDIVRMRRGERGEPGVVENTPPENSEGGEGEEVSPLSLSMLSTRRRGTRAGVQSVMVGGGGRRGEGG
jgi:hypothetical protein